MAEKLKKDFFSGGSNLTNGALEKVLNTLIEANGGVAPDGGITPEVTAAIAAAVEADTAELKSTVAAQAQTITTQGQTITSQGQAIADLTTRVAALETAG